MFLFYLFLPDFIHNVEEVFEMDVQGFIFYSPLIEFVFLSTKGLFRLFSTKLVVNCKKLFFVVFQFEENPVLNLHATWITLLWLSVTVFYHRAAKASRS